VSGDERKRRWSAVVVAEHAAPLALPLPGLPQVKGGTLLVRLVEDGVVPERHTDRVIAVTLDEDVLEVFAEARRRRRRRAG
jgi:hypothetical protein